MLVIKRDGRKASYSSRYIVDAILMAAARADTTMPDLGHVLTNIEKKLEGKQEIHVAEIQDIVENALMNSKYKAVAKEYISYRTSRDIARESGSKLLQDIESFIDRSSDEFMKENANKDTGVVSTHRDLLAGILSKHMAITQLVPKDVAEAHTRGVIHQHDLDYYLSSLTNCSNVNYVDMLENGFKIGDAQISKPKSIGVATTILTQIAQAVASGQYGGQTHAHIDTGLAQYVKASHSKLLREAEELVMDINEGFRGWGTDQWVKEWTHKKLEKEVYDAMQSLLYQVNTLTTSNGQTPFITISIGLDTSYYGRMITEQYLKVHMEGIGENKATPVFPKVVFFLEDGVNLKEGDPNYDLKKLAVECSTKRIYPDYISVPKNREITGVNGIPVSPMGERITA
jgi:ribonucleoside-triphosphate reductase